MRKETLNWLKQAEADLRSGKHCITSKDYYLAVFVFQQSVEKALKACYLVKFGELPLGHSIIYFATKLKIPEKLLESIRDLSPAYLIARYPDIAGEVPDEIFDSSKAEKHRNTAEEVLLWVKNQIQK